MRLRTLAVTLLAATALAGCSSSDGSSSSATPTTDPSSAAGVSWSPCDGLTAAQVGRMAGQRMKEVDGTAAAPRCTFTPVAKGGPAFDVSYLSYDGGLDAALEKMGAEGRQLTKIEVPGADAARIVVRPRRTGLLVTGFVQTQGLVQSVNAVELTPYDVKALSSATKQLLARLASKAPDPSS